MKLSVIIVNYNVRYFIEQCIVSVHRATEGLESELLVVDNHSKDDSVSYLRERFGNSITLIESQHNLGFARANNMAIRQSTGEYVLLLNPDTFVSEDSIRRVLSFMDAHPKAGGAGVMMHNADGTMALESRRALPTPWVSLMKMLGFSQKYYMSKLPWDEPGQIDVMSGAFCMLRRKALDTVGLLDEDFFMYGEDIDLSYRIKKGGFENWYVPAEILHYKGESTQKSSFRYVHVFYQAMLIFFRKHYGHLSLFVTIPIKMAIYFRAFIALIQMQYWRMRKSLGFVSDNNEHTEYVIKGSEKMMEECEQLMQRMGLNTAGQSADKQQCVVYDIDRYSFCDIIHNAAEAKGTHIIGTYSTKSKVLITPKEVFR